MYYITIMNYTIDEVLAAMTTVDYPIFTNDKREYNLNIVGVRNSDRAYDKFNDTLCVFYKYNGNWTLHQFAITLDPGVVYRNEPINDAGTAIIMPGFYKSMWRSGMHKSKYPALVQNKSCTVIRDNNKDSNLDVEIPNHISTRTSSVTHGITQTDYINQVGDVVFTTQTGMFGINCHKSGKGTTEFVNYYSAGCVVFSDNNEFDNEFLPICDAAANTFGDSFSFSLILDSYVRMV